VTVTLNGGSWYQNNSIANIGTLNLVNGGILTTEAGYSSAYPSISIRGPVITVSGSGESIIQTTNQGNTVYNIRLSGSNNSTSDITTFNVGKTTASGPDLLVEANIEDGWAYNTQNIVATTLIKSGSGTMSLTGTNAWSGGTQINGGILSLGSAGALPTAAYNTANAGTLSASGAVGAISFGGGTLQFTAANTTDYSANFSTAANQWFSFDTNGQNVTLASGLVSSSGSLTVVDSHAAIHGGILTLTGASTYNGATTINAGATLQLGDGTTGHDGTIAGTSGVTDNGTLIYDRFGSTSAGYAIGGTGAVTVMGSGTQTLSGSSSFTGATTVSGGTLLVSGSLSGTVSASVASGATLELDGSLNNAATVTISGALQGTGSVGGITANGGSLSAGLTAANSSMTSGTLTAAGAVTLSGSTNFNIRVGMLTGGTDSDELYVSGNNTVSLNGANLQLTLGGFINSAAPNTVYTIINDPGVAVTGAFSNGPVISMGGYQFTILYDENAAGTGAGNDVDLELTPVPEPGTWATFALGTVLLLRFQTKRRRRTGS
jgi:autotransporter-associated beta strand protein